MPLTERGMLNLRHKGSVSATVKPNRKRQRSPSGQRRKNSKKNCGNSTLHKWENAAGERANKRPGIHSMVRAPVLCGNLILRQYNMCFLSVCLLTNGARCWHLGQRSDHNPKTFIPGCYYQQSSCICDSGDSKNTSSISFQNFVEHKQHAVVNK